MSRTLWLNPAVGVAGDMIVASLLDVGADESALRRELDTLDLDGWTMHVEAVTRAALTATHVRVETTETHHHRSWSAIDRMLQGSGLSPRVGAGARATFRRLADAEATVHGIDVDSVHFHEVGALDAIVDIVAAWAALESLDVDRVVAAPVGLGTGLVEMAHGAAPVPAPAVLELLRGHPTVPMEHRGETATPTGVALLCEMADSWGALPAGVIRASGRGAGSADPGTHANVLSVVLTDSSVSSMSGASCETAVLLETNLDDVTPELLGHVVELALERGAQDAWVTPIVMKKGRPAHLLSVLCAPGSADSLRELIASRTATLGIRQLTIDKFESPRRTEHVTLDGRTVRIKVGPHDAKPEHDDVVAVASATGAGVRLVAARALAAWHDHDHDDHRDHRDHR